MRNTLRAAVIGAATTVVAVTLAATASAHVEVSGIDATQGGYGVLTFRVPTESDTASTTDVLVTLPDDQPVLSVDTQPKPGWTATVTRKKLAAPRKDDDGNDITDYVSTVEWKADNPQAGIPPNQFDMFSVSAGPLPKEAMIYLPAVQTYSDGKIVRWDEKAAMGGAEPAHPAPMLMLSADEHGSMTTAADAGAASTPGAPAWLSVAALVVALGAAALSVGNLVLLRRRSS